MMKITELWAFVSMDSEGEGLVAFRSATGWMPMVAADRARVEDLRPLAEEIAQKTGATIELRRFTTMTAEEVIEPKEKPA